MNERNSVLPRYSALAGVFVLGGLGGFFLFAFAYLVVTDPGDNITLVESDVRTGPKGERVLTGTLRNNTDDPYAFVQADIHLVDKTGRVVRDTAVATRHLEAGGTWSFDVPIRAEKATRAVLEGQCGRRYHVHAQIPLTSQVGSVHASKNRVRPSHIATVATGMVACLQKDQTVLKRLTCLVRIFLADAQQKIST